MASRSVALSRPSDPPLAFREDRRGKSPRSDRDFAELAVAYLAAVSRRAVAREWSERFGRNPQRWRMDLAKARELFIVEGSEGDLRLSEAGEILVYGRPLAPAEVEEIARAEWLDFMVNGTDSVKRGLEMVRVGRSARRSGVRVSQRERDLIALAKRRLAQAEAALYSLETPQERRED
jgi:hypothetical protein